jgi:hypothetical protein
LRLESILFCSESFDCNEAATAAAAEAAAAAAEAAAAAGKK